MEPTHIHRSPHRFLVKRNKGFTLVELMVVLTIIVVITAVTLTSQSSFNKSLILANTAYDIALTLRSAQTYGLSSRARSTDIGVTSPNAGYGLHFETGGTFTLFADTGGSPLCHTPPINNDPSGPDAKPGNCVYDVNKKVLNYVLGNGITVNNFCAYAGSWSCTRGTSTVLNSLDIVFTRPDPEPSISTNGSYNSALSAACISITSPQGGAKNVSIGASGQIIANAACCDISCL